ncbi:MAG: 2-hydroxyacyl-CoA dehydratase family protein [Deltaproteobacteria bacterium]
MPGEKERPQAGFRSTSKLKQLMAAHFHELADASATGARKIAWCTSVGPVELLRGMGFLVYFPENHAAMLGASRMAVESIPYANAVGYSPDICSYLTSDIGSFLRKKTPLTAAYQIASVPKPDVLVFNTNQCRDVKDWFAWYAREFQAPLLGIHTHRELGEIREYQVGDIARQMEEMVPALEAVAGEKLRRDRFEEAVSLSRDTSLLWKACLEMNASFPAPWTFFDATIHMGPAVIARGTQESVGYYETLLAELKERTAAGISTVTGEKHRIYWEGMPVWGKLRPLAEQFSALNASVVASTYCNSWIFDQLDPADPFASMARAYTELFIVRDEAYKEEYIRRCFDFYKFDGILFHDAKTCPNNSNNRYGMPERLMKRLGIPTLTINGDLNDLRCYSEEQARTNIEAFMEQLAEST